MNKFNKKLVVSGRYNMCFEISAIYALMIHPDIKDGDIARIISKFGENYKNIEDKCNLEGRVDESKQNGEVAYTFAKLTMLGDGDEKIIKDSNIEIIELDSTMTKTRYFGLF